MSAYAFSSFSSYLSPAIGVGNDTIDTKSNTKLDQSENIFVNIVSNNNNEPEHKTAIRIKVKSANIDAGVLVRSSSAKFSSRDHNCFSVPDDAVRFKLSIKFNGRKYTATRSFAKFVKLRRELVKELSMSINIKAGSKDQRRSISQACMDVNGRQQSSSKAESMLPKLPAIISDQVDGSYHFALPRMSSGYSMAKAAASVPLNFGSFGGLSGFTKLQSLLLCYYSPIIECWLKRVMDVIDVDTSKCLNNFLWEPLRDSSSIPSLVSSTNSNSSEKSSNLSRKSSTCSVLSLTSINEGFEDLM